MASERIQYKWSDAWLLLSILYASQGEDATLDRIISAGDYINHAIFTPEELESGFSRLTLGGYIQESDGVFQVTDNVMNSYRKTTTPRRAVFKEVEDMSQLLDATPSTAKEPLPNPENNLSYPGFSLQLYKEATNKYVGRFNKKRR